MESPSFTQHVHVLGVDLLVSKKDPFTPTSSLCCARRGRRRQSPSPRADPTKGRLLVRWWCWGWIHRIVEKVLVHHISQFLRQLQEWRGFLRPLLHPAVLLDANEEQER